MELGREAAAEVRKQYPVITDEKIAAYLTKLGDRLVAAAPAELKQPVYEYSFTPVNVKDINAFALPGGPMFVNRGMFDAAASEGEGQGDSGCGASCGASAREGHAQPCENISACAAGRASCTAGLYAFNVAGIGMKSVRYSDPQISSLP